MIDNPLPYQVEKDDDEIHFTNQYYEHCADKAHEIAKEFNLLSEFYDDFAEYFTDLCLDSDDGYSLTYSKDLIDDWWDEYGDDYDDYSSPYDIDPIPDGDSPYSDAEYIITAEERNRKAFEQKLINKG